MSRAVLSIRTCVCAVTTFEPSSRSNKLGPISAPSSPIMARTTRSLKKGETVWHPSAKYDGGYVGFVKRGRRPDSQLDIIDARDRGEQRDHDHPDHAPMTRIETGSSKAISRLMTISTLLLGQRRSGFEHFGEPAGAFAGLIRFTRVSSKIR